MDSGTDHDVADETDQLNSDCPECGCVESRLVNTRFWRHVAWEVRACENCGRTFSVPSEEYRFNFAEVADSINPRVIIVVMRCPNCGAEWPPATSSPLPVRYHKCKECGHRFKSVEKN